jgi:photosystem II stability/assembly factor-like uncharacterized protein
VKYFLLLLFGAFIQTTHLNAQWRCANAYTGSISDIYFPDRLTGYAATVAGGIGNCFGTGSILRTVDGGENWVRMNTASNAAMTRLHFFDKFTGWAVGASSTVQKTTDGGQTWTVQTSGVGAGYNDIHFANASVGCVVGANGIVRMSSNGGSSWSTVSSGVSTTLTSVFFINATTGFFVGNSGVLRKTTNGGSSWSSVYSGSDYFKEVWFADTQNGYVLSNNKILKTTNGGSSWQTIDAPAGSIWLRMHFTSVSNGYIFGDLNTVLRTTDGGLTWQQSPSDFNEAVTCGFFLDELNGYVGGDRGRITRTDNGAQTWNQQITGLGRVYGISIRDAETSIAVGTAGQIYRTKNASLTHRKIESNTRALLSAVKWLDHNTLLACGDSGVVVRSTDEGFTWARMNTGTTQFLADMWSPDAQTAYCSGANGTIIKSIDAGITWQDVSILETETFDGVHFLNPLRGMVVGGNKIYRTLNGGQTWELKNTDVQVNTSFSDVWVANDTLAYAAGGFGKFYWTNDGGEAWEAIWPSGTSNAEIDEMVFINDTVGYFARFNSQSYTLNGGFTVGSQSTYCLANNGGVDAIDVYNTSAGVYGACSGGISNVYHTVAPDSLTKTYLQDSIFCAGSRIFVGYLATGLLYNSEVITAQLSDASGSFANPTTLSSYTVANPSISPSGIITCTLPSGLNGNAFRIRVVCTSRNFVSPDNGFNIRIQSSIQPSLTLNANPPAACGGEPVQVNVQGIGLGQNPAYSWTLNGTALENEAPAILLDTLSTQATISISVTSSLTCANPSVSTASRNIAISAAPVANAGDDVSLCESETAQIGSPTTDAFTWTPTIGLSDPNSPEPFTSVTETTQYVITVTNVAGCTSTDTVLVQVNPVPANLIISLAGGELVIAGNPQGQITWYRNDEIIDDENNDTLLITATGNYQAYFEDEFGCSSTSNVIAITTVGLSDINKDIQAHIFIGGNTINISDIVSQHENFDYKIYDLSGQILSSGNANSSGYSVSIQAPKLASGIYIIQLSAADYQTALKFIWQ